MHYALTLFLMALTPMGNVVPARTAAVFETLDACLAVAVGGAYPGLKYTCDPAAGDPAQATKATP